MNFGQNGYKAGTISTISAKPPSSRLSEDKLLMGSYEDILARSYNLFRNSAIPSAISNNLTNYIGGRCLTPIGVPDEVSKLWTEWSSHSSIIGGRGMSQDYRDIIGGQVESGDILLTTVTDRSLPQKMIRTKIQLISGSRVRTPSFIKEDSTKNVRLGVEYNSQGKEIGYWVAKEDKSNSHKDKREDYTFIPRRDLKTGRFVAQLMRRPAKMIPGQTRGLPIITPIMQELEDIASLWDSAINGANTKALLSVMLEIESPDDFNAAVKAKNDSDSTVEFTDNYGLTNPVGTLESNTVTLVPPGTRAVPIHHQGNQDLDVLFHRINLYISAALGIPYEILFKDFSKTNFSSGKIGLDSFYRMSDMWTDSNAQVLTNILKLIVREAELKGLITPQELGLVRWIGPSRVDVDPGKNSKAETERLGNGLKTKSEYLGEQGKTFEDHLLILKAEEETRKRLGFEESEKTENESELGDNEDDVEDNEDLEND